MFGHVPTRKEDEKILQMLFMRDHLGARPVDIAARYNATRGKINGQLNRIDATSKGDNGIGNGTMKPDWWRAR